MPHEERGQNLAYVAEHPIPAPIPEPVNCIENGESTALVDAGIRRLSVHVNSRTRSSPAAFVKVLLSDPRQNGAGAPLIAPAVGMLVSGKIRTKGAATEEQALLAVQVKLNQYLFAGIPVSLQDIAVSNQVYSVAIAVPVCLYFLKYILGNLETYDSENFTGAILEIYYDWTNDRLLRREYDRCAKYKMVVHRIGKVNITGGMEFPAVVMHRMWQRVFTDVFSRVIDRHSTDIKSKDYSVVGKAEADVIGARLEAHQHKRQRTGPRTVQRLQALFFPDEPGPPLLMNG